MRPRNDPKSDVQYHAGYALYLAQRGEKHDDAKLLKDFGGAGVLEAVQTTPETPIGRSTR